MPIRDKIDPRAARVVTQLVESGFEAYLVGGAVRDLMLDLEPKDYDIATSASPEEVRNVFGRRRARIIGRRFRLVHVYVEGEVYEVSTFRREPTAEERRGREDDEGLAIWRDNEYGTLEQDAWRRDFTVNSIYYDVAGGSGFVDYVGGVEDLHDGLVRAIGETPVRLAEDPVRLLRALKLAGQYAFRLEPGLEQAVRQQANQIDTSSRARLFEELLKILGRSYSHPTFSAFQEYGLLDHFWPNLACVWGSAQGELMRAVLAERDRCLQADGYTKSKTLALATVCAIPVIHELSQGDFDGLWEHGSGLERPCRDVIANFFSPFQPPRVLSARVRDLFLLLPRFRECKRMNKLMHHPEYKYARELFLVVGKALGWPQDQLDFWPEPEPRHEHHSPVEEHGRRGRRSRRKRRSRS